MAYTFRSRSAPGVTLLQVNGDELLRLVGKAPSARGVIAPEDLPAAIVAIEAAIAPLPPAAVAAADDEDDGAALITLRQRALPFLDLLRRARDAGEPVTWGIV